MARIALTVIGMSCYSILFLFHTTHRTHLWPFLFSWTSKNVGVLVSNFICVFVAMVCAFAVACCLIVRLAWCCHVLLYTARGRIHKPWKQWWDEL